MRILLVSRHCLVGGAEAFMLALRSGLHRHGHQCELFFFRHGEMERYFPDDCVAHFGDLADCMRLVKQQRFDVVHGRSSDWEIGLSAVRMPGTRLVVTSHGFIAPGWNSDNCDAFVSCARWLADQLQPLTDIPLQVVLNGIDTSRFVPVEDLPVTSPPIVAWVGRGIDPRKGLDRFAAIAPLLRAAGMRLWLIEPHGAASVAQVDPQAARTLLPLADFWSAVPLEGMPALYQTVAASGGCVVSTASWEGLPLTLLEAQACGCPVIAPDVRGTNECVDPAHGGVLYPFELDAAPLAELVAATLRDTEALRERSRACANYARAHFSLERMTRDYLDVYEHAPYAEHATSRDRAGARRLLSPVANWAEYVAHRWSPGQRQYEAAQKLATQGDWPLARAAARSALATSPTIYANPHRLAFLAKAYW